MKKWIFVIVLVGMIGWVVYDFVIKEDNSQEGIAEQQKKLDDSPAKDEVGLGYDQIAPDFELAVLDGESMKLSDFRGEPVMINFWATWCPPCQAEMPDMERFYQETNMTIFSVNGTTSEPNLGQVREFIADFELTFPILLDDKREVADIYSVAPIPVTYILDADGRTHFKTVGPINYDIMMAKYNELK